MPAPAVGDRVEVKVAGFYRFGIVTVVDRERRCFWMRFADYDWDSGPFAFEVRTDV
jgi:hypothetical protein